MAEQRADEVEADVDVVAGDDDVAAGGDGLGQERRHLVAEDAGAHQGGQVGRGPRAVEGDGGTAGGVEGHVEAGAIGQVALGDAGAGLDADGRQQAGGHELGGGRELKRPASAATPPGPRWCCGRR
ncbi:MAG: hypothetical protein R3F60_09210 [bacterium]